MFERFGEFDSAEELNKKAAELLANNDEKSLLALAKENGLDEDDVYDYVDGVFDTLTTLTLAAHGKIEVEANDLEIQGILTDWKDVVINSCTEDEELCRSVRKKGKSLKECMAALIKFSFENKVQISDKIVDVTQVRHNGRLEKMRKPLYLGVPNKAEAKKIIREYYLGGGK